MVFRILTTRCGLIVSSFLVLLMEFTANTSHAQTSADSDRIEYVVKVGDTLIGLANKYMLRPNDYRTVQRLNRIANPRALPVGSKLEIPFSLLKYRSSSATLAAFRGNVSIVSAGRSISPFKGVIIGEGNSLATAASGFLTLQLEDGSRVSMPSNSKIRVTRLRQIMLTNSLDYEFSVESGRMRSKVNPFNNKADRYRVRTPVAVSAVRGTDFRTRVDGVNATTFSETVEGRVDVASGLDTSAANVVSVSAGAGAAVKVSGELIKATLLAPPELIESATVQSDERLIFTAVSTPYAVAHHIVLSSDAGFVDVVAEATADGNIVTFPELADGRYFARATSIAVDGFEGMPSTYSFKRQLATLSGSADRTDFGYRFKWDGVGSGKRIYRFQLALNNKDAIPIIDEASLADSVITLSDLADGDYYWRVGVTQFPDSINENNEKDEALIQKWTDFEKLIVAN